MTLGQSLTNVRKKVGISQKEAAIRLEISYHHMNEIENDNAYPSMPVFMRMAEIYGVPISILTWPMATEEDVKPELVAQYRKMKADIDQQIETVYFNNK